MIRHKSIFLLLIAYGSAIAQFPSIDQSHRYQMIKQKAIHYNQMIQNEMQITTNQNDYDITYYSLNLTPDLVTSTLYGVVEVVGEVEAQNLDRVELNFWD